MTKPTLIVTEDSSTCGGVTYWELRGDVALVELRARWLEAGLDEDALPEAPSPEAALNRAVHAQASRARLARRLPGKNGWALVDERAAGTDDLEYSVELRAKFDTGILVVEPWSHPLSDDLQAEFRRQMGILCPTVISAWLVNLARKLDGVCLREQGGLYFIPRTRLAEWRATVGVLELVSTHHVRQIPALRADEAVASVLAAITVEAEDVASKLAEDLSAGELGERGLNNRAGEASALKEKLLRYEELLGASLEGLRDKLDGLRAGLAAAALLAADKAAKEAA